MSETRGVAPSVVEATAGLTHDAAVEDREAMTTPTGKRTTSPAFQFYPNDFLGSPKVQIMSAVEVGAYWLLICACWNEGSLPCDLGRLAAIARVTRGHFTKMWEHVLGECFYQENGRYHQRRLDRERKKQREFSRRQSENANAGWERRRNATAMPPHSQASASGIDVAMLSISNSISNSVSKKEHARSALERAFDGLWSIYPRKVGKDAAWREFKRISPNEDVVLAMHREVNRQAQTWTDPKYTPHLRTWLHHGRWKDEAEPLKASPVSRPEWVCPHVEQCDNRAKCEQATILGRPHRAKESA